MCIAPLRHVWVAFVVEIEGVVECAGRRRIHIGIVRGGRATLVSAHERLARASDILSATLASTMDLFVRARVGRILGVNVLIRQLVGRSAIRKGGGLGIAVPV